MQNDGRIGQPTVTSTQYQLEVGEIEAQLLTRVEAVKGGSGIDLPFPRPDRSLKKLRARLKDAGEEYLLLHRRRARLQVQQLRGLRFRSASNTQAGFLPYARHHTRKRARP